MPQGTLLWLQLSGLWFDFASSYERCFYSFNASNLWRTCRYWASIQYNKECPKELFFSPKICDFIFHFTCEMFLSNRLRKRIDKRSRIPGLRSRKQSQKPQISLSTFKLNNALGDWRLKKEFVDFKIESVFKNEALIFVNLLEIGPRHVSPPFSVLAMTTLLFKARFTFHYSTWTCE